MRGYVERLEWLEKCSDGPVGYDEVMDSYRQEADFSQIDNPKRPHRALCRRCWRNIPVESHDGKHCIDRHDCSKALLARNARRKEREDG